MLENTYQLRSEFALPATAHIREKEINGLTISVSSPCIGKASKVCCDIEGALLLGAVPGAQVIMHQSVAKANQDSLPLACALSFGC